MRISKGKISPLIGRKIGGKTERVKKKQKKKKKRVGKETLLMIRGKGASTSGPKKSEEPKYKDASLRKEKQGRERPRVNWLPRKRYCDERTKKRLLTPQGRKEKLNYVAKGNLPRKEEKKKLEWTRNNRKIGGGPTDKKCESARRSPGASGGGNCKKEK